MSPDEIVSLCTTQNAVEAATLCEALAEEGIEARVVGDVMSAADGLPPGEGSAPQVWVRERDMERAREFLAVWNEEDRQAESLQGPDVEGESEEDLPDEGAPEAGSPDMAADSATPTKSTGRSWSLAGLFFLGGVVLLIFSGLGAWRSWQTLRQYSGETEGVLKSAATIVTTRTEQPPELPFDPTPRKGEVKKQLGYYEYVVDGKTYKSQIEGTGALGERITVHYDPHDPAAHVLGVILPPWLLMLFSAAATALLWFVGYQIR